MKVFISWSGDLAKAVALALREWLPLLFDRVAPWASDTDIAAGQRGLAQIEAELADTRFGPMVVTAENQHAAWLNFEAGALSRTIASDTEHRVVPLLVDLVGPAELTGPLAQFQAKTVRMDGLRDVVRSLAAVAGVDQGMAGKRFDAYWPQLEAQIDAARAAATRGGAAPERREEADVLGEILLHVRSLRSHLVTPPSGGVLTRTATERQQHEFQKFVTHLAAAHGMEVFEIKGPAFGDREITLSPKGEYSEGAVQAFKQAFYEQTEQSHRNDKLEVIPF